MGFQEVLQKVLATKEPVGAFNYSAALLCIGYDSAKARGLLDDYRRLILGVDDGV